jgi:hypothetical protein
LRVQGKAVPYGSPQAGYSLGRILGRATAKTKLTDDGAYTRLVMEGARKFGVARESDWPLSEENLNADLPPDILQRGSAWKVDEYYRIFATGDARVQAFAQALANRYPLVVETYTDEPFDTYKGGEEPIPAPKTKEGAHAIAVIAYRTRNGKKEFLIANSWSRWGLPNSLGWANEEWVKATLGAFAVSFSVGESAGGPKTFVPRAVKVEDEPEAEEKKPEAEAAPAKKVKR